MRRRRRNTQTLWSERFSKPLSSEALSFSSSFPCDRRLYKFDILASIAHARMLTNCGILKEDEGELIVNALESLLKEIE